MKIRHKNTSRKKYQQKWDDKTIWKKETRQSKKAP